MNTYIVKTGAHLRTKTGKPGRRWHETFVVIADTPEEAEAKAVSVAWPGSEITMCKIVEGSIARIHVG